MPKVQELREADDWKRFANVSIQEQLCAKMEALQRGRGSRSHRRAQVRELQQQWREAADVPRAQADALWRRFKAAHDEVWARCEAHFAAQAQERAENLAKKIALCEQAEALADSTQLDSDGRSDQEAAGRVEDHRSGVARQGKGDLGSLPRGLRSLLHPPPRGPRRSARRSWAREPREEGRAVRARRGAGRIDRLGCRRRPRSRSSRPSGGRSAR